MVVARHSEMVIALTRRTSIILAVVSCLVVILLLVAAMFPVSWLKDRAEARLAERFGSPVTIEAVEREALFSFRPVIRITGVRVAQPDWAGQGEMASIDLLRLRLSLPALLRGRFSAALLTARGVRLTLVRAADGRVNWRRESEREAQGGGSGMAVVDVEDALVRYSDALQKRSATLAVRIDPATGLHVAGKGMVDGAPVRVAVRGGSMIADRPWAFDAIIDGPALGIRATGRMAGPMRTDAMRFRMTARADDLKRVDRIIEAGLFGTQPVALSADVRHEDRAWTIEGLKGTIGRSPLTGRLTARKDGDRTKLDGDVRFSRLDFEDLASDAGNARAVALEQAQGLRLVPATRINIRKIDSTDGRIAVRVDRVEGGRRPSSLRSIEGVLLLDNRILTVDPLRIGLAHGAITGKVVVDQRAGQPKPTVTLALDMTDSRISALAGGGDNEIDGRVDAVVRLTGVGDTVREAVGKADGRIGVAARAGSLPTKIAVLLGFDIGRGVFGDTEGRATLRCAVLRLEMRDGVGTVAPLLIDTSVSQTRGTGTIRFPGEEVTLSLTGVPKGDAALRLPGPIMARGTVRTPEIVIPKGTRSVGTVLKALGRAIAGKNDPAAGDAACDRLTHHALAR